MAIRKWIQYIDTNNNVYDILNVKIDSNKFIKLMDGVNRSKDI
jgi:hypothetical protein